MRQARFEIVYRDDDLIQIRDVGPWDKNPTVTNDADGVVLRMYREHDLQQRVLIYEDSEGELGELLHHGPIFVGFGPAWMERRE